MTAETIDPIVGFAALRQVVVAIARAGIRSHVQIVLVGSLVENRRVIAAVKVGVCFNIEVLGKEPAAITQSHGKKVARTGAAAGPRLVPRLEPGHEGQGEREEKTRDQWSLRSPHMAQFTALRLNNAQAPTRKSPA